MAVRIIKSYISKEKSAQFYDYLDSYSLVSSNPNILNALGYPTSAIASQTDETTGALHGIDHPTNKELGRLFVDIKGTAEDFFETEIDLCQANYQVLLPGAENLLHADAMHLDGSPIQADGPEEEIKWSGLLYLNTYGVDFLGGKLSFPGFDIEYCPVAGDLVLFQGDVEHRHAVSKVISGHRKNIVFFWSDRGNISEENFFSAGYSK
jgi:hypothetical protein